MYEESEKGWEGTRDEHPTSGVFRTPAWIANRGAIFRWGVSAEPTLGALCNSSPKMQPTDHMSTAFVYPPRDMTTCTHAEMFTQEMAGGAKL